MQLEISNNRTIHEVQLDFSSQYPFLKLEFCKMKKIPSIRVRQYLPQSASLRSAGLKKAGQIEISNEMTVGELEKMLDEQFGLTAQVCRNSGGIWLETTMTDGWSLGKQNDYGREIIRHARRSDID